jgi:hypothetical protein
MGFESDARKPLNGGSSIILGPPMPSHVMIPKIFQDGILFLLYVLVAPIGVLYVLVAPIGVEKQLFSSNGKIT